MRSFVLVHGGGLDDAARCLQPLGASLHQQQGLAGVSRDSAFDLAIVDYDALSAAGRAELRSAFAGPVRKTRLVVVSGGACRADYGDLFGGGVLTNLVARSDVREGGDLLVTVDKLFSPVIGGLEPWIPTGDHDVTIEVLSSRDRGACRDAALEFASTHGKSRRLAEGFCDALDEFLTNALYNGPRDADSGTRWYDRQTDVTLREGEAVTVRFRADARRLGVSVSDPFGTLAPHKVTDYLAKCFRAGDDQVDTKEGGAGLGLYYVFERFSHFVLNITPGRSTEVIGLLDIDTAARRAKEAEKSFNIFCGQAQ